MVVVLASVNPATGETLRSFETDSPDVVSMKLQKALTAFGEHRETSFSQRSEKMQRAARILEDEKEKFGRLMTLEMGKPIRAAAEEAAKCALACRYYAENAANFLADEVVATNAAKSFIRYQPLGPVLAIMPWNFPFWQVFRFAAPALMAGNVGLLKHASNVPQCALAIEDVFRRAGFAEGVFQTLLIGSKEVEAIIDDSRIRAVTLTGSEEAGIKVASRAGSRIKKTVLELGGSDPFLVMPSADLDTAVQTAVRARVINNGQSCIAAKRFIVHIEIAPEFERRFVERMRKLKVGDPLDESTEVGPLATEAIVDGLDDQVKRSVAAGARVLTGGKRIDRPGNYYQPTVLSDIPADSPAAVEELFGPVASLFVARDAEEAIKIANGTEFGLGASAWTTDSREQERFIEGLDSGMVFLNGMVASDPRLPFGGVKRSGYGRELGVVGIREFVNMKTVWVGGTTREASGTE
jgi:succinate-semialdehyde dehydrogenase/glutarate-semialdehyde dehydrogenase